MNEYFTTCLLNYGRANPRDLPWVGVKDPYKVWLSEVILQQTRVAQGLPYFERFLEAFPTVEEMAAADNESVMKLWEGLGYYSRARNMHATAKLVVAEFNGHFPDTYKELLSLKGVGPYTAAAIGSFAFNLPLAVVDGNVYRLLSRFYGIETAIDSSMGKKQFAELAQELLPERKSAAYNQAIMDFGSQVCKPRQPLCEICPLADRCIALSAGSIDRLPVKEKKLKRKQRFFNYCVIEKGAQVWLRKREGKDIWQNLYEFPLIERDGKEDVASLLASKTFETLLPISAYELKAVSPWIKHELTHQQIFARFFHLSIPASVEGKADWGIAVDRDLMHNFAFPRLISRYLN